MRPSLPPTISHGEHQARRNDAHSSLCSTHVLLRRPQVCETALNHDALASFTLTFIGEGNLFRALQGKLGGFRDCRVDVETSLTFLRYVRDAGHPLYAGLDIPDVQAFGEELTGLSQSASAAARLREDPLLRAIETKMENGRSGASLLINPSGTSSSTASQVDALIGMLRRAKGSDKETFTRAASRGRLRSNVKPPACWCLLVPYMPLARS